MKNYWFPLFIAIAISAPTVRALEMTFRADVAGQVFEFSVRGNVLASENIIYSGSVGTTWNDEWEIEGVSDWSTLSRLVPPSYPDNDNSYGQMVISDHLNLNRGFRYHELVNGFDRSTKELWSQEIDIRPLVSNSDPIDSLLNIPAAFSYEEHSAFAENYTPDGSTTPIWTRFFATGTLTLIGYDSSIGREGSPSGGKGVPDSGSTLALLAVGLGFLSTLRNFQGVRNRNAAPISTS